MNPRTLLLKEYRTSEIEEHKKSLKINGRYIKKTKIWRAKSLRKYEAVIEGL